MARLSIGKIGGEPLASRVVIHFRVAPDVIELFPAFKAQLGDAGDGELDPAWIVRGYAVVSACYSRRRLVGGLLTRESFGYRFAGRPLATAEEPARTFEHEEDRFALRLTVRAGETEELRYSGETCGQPAGSLFASTREASEYLARDSSLAAGRSRAWEPLATAEVQCSFTGLLPVFAELCGRLEFDSAFRQVAQRVVLLPDASRLRALRAKSAPANPLPSS